MQSCNFTGHKPVPSDAYDVSAMLQLTYDRLHYLILSMKQWDGPMQVAIHGTDAELLELTRNTELTDMLHQRKNVAIHAVYKRMVQNTFTFF